MSNAEIIFLTQNPDKLAALAWTKQRANAPHISFSPRSPTIPEIQAPTSLEVAGHAALHHAALWKKPVLREDHALCFRALGGWPATFAAYAVQQISPLQLLRLLEGETDRSGYFELGTVLAFPNGETWEYQHRVEITVLPSCHSTSRWDGVLALPQTQKAFCDSSASERLPLFAHNLVSILNRLCNS